MTAQPLHILFDLAGTLFSSRVDWERENQEGARRISQQVGPAAASEILQVSRRERHRAKEERIEYSLREVIRRVADAHGKQCTDQQLQALVERYISPELKITKLRPGMKRLTQDLRGAGYILSVISNSPTEEFVRLSLQSAGLTPVFSNILVSCQLGYRKPHPRFTAAVKSIIGLSQALIVGDRLYDDVGLAQALGLPSVLCAIDQHPDNAAYAGQLTPTATAMSVPEIREHIQHIYAPSRAT